MRFLILALWAVLLPSFALADTRPVNCEITVGGVRHVTGRCYFSPRSGGSFQVGNDSYFADVSVNTPGQADGHWNADPLSTHAQAPLGALRQEGACWVAPGTRICAWALPAAETQAALAAQPDGVMLSPISASSACIGAAGPLMAGQPLELHNCRLGQDRLFDIMPGGRITVNKHPDLCIGLEAPGMMKPAELVLQPCDEVTADWYWVQQGQFAFEGMVRRGGDGTCWTILQETRDPSMSFPWPVNAVPCDAQAEQTAHFAYSRE